MICDFNVPYKFDYETVTFENHPTREQRELWEMVGGDRQGVGFGRRVALAASHLCHIPESIFNLVTNLVKVIFTAIACAFSFGQVDLLKNEFRLALGRTFINFAGIGINTIGIFAPINAVKWKMELIMNTVEKLKGDALDEDNNPSVIVPMMMSI